MTNYNVLISCAGLSILIGWNCLLSLCKMSFLRTSNFHLQGDNYHLISNSFNGKRAGKPLKCCASFSIWLSVSSPSIIQPTLVSQLVCHCCPKPKPGANLLTEMSDSLPRMLLRGQRRHAETQSSPGATVLSREEGHRIMTSPTTGCMMSWGMLIPCRLYGYPPIIYSFTSANVLPETTPTFWRRPKTSFITIRLGFFFFCFFFLRRPC